MYIRNIRSYIAIAMHANIRMILTVNVIAKIIENYVV